MSIQIASSNPVSADGKKGPSASIVEISSTAITNGAAFGNDQLPKQLVDAMQAIFGKHQGYRTSEYSNSYSAAHAHAHAPPTAHAKGLLVEGTFTPTKEAKDLSTAAHFNNCSTKVIARFSVGGGLPHVADVSDGATPKGIAIRFQVDDNTHTDLISHSFNGFATRNGEDFLTFLKLFGTDGRAEAILKKAKAGGGDTTKEQKAYDEAHASFVSFLKKPENQSAAIFVGSEKPNPHSYGTITYYEPNTHILTNRDGKVTNVRYRLDPADGVHLYPNKTPEDKQKLAQLGNNYLEDDLQQRFPEKPVIFTIQAHVADPDDVLDDATKPYKSTTFVPVGRLEINKVSADNVAQQQQIAFSPNPEKGGIEGIKASNDPLIQARKGVYWISADQRRNEKQVE